MQHSLKIEYYILNDTMSDDELSNAPERVFELTKDMIIELMEKHIPLDRKLDEYIDRENLYLKVI